ncbi:glycoside hydrolase family 2 [Parabacteroides sp. OttesenSCG-928-G06]|nr:glycoside hydrolase family 2 [Parabacteroides sp. OttesenSCG-928-G06]
MNTLKYFLLCCCCMHVVTSAANNDSILRFETAADYYPIVNAKTKINHTPVPVSVVGVKHPTISLHGNWWFSTKPETDFERKTFHKKNWHQLSVPSEWYMHSFEVEKDNWAGYYKEIHIPADWQDKRVLIRFGTVQSECRIYMNGEYVGSHTGSMTQFEKELTPYLKKGKNALAMYVRSESFSDQSSRISHYAKHQVGGILRQVELVALPENHINTFHCDALLNEELTVGQLTIHTGLSKDTKGAEIEVVVRERGIEGLFTSDKIVFKNRTITPELSVTINNPQLWHAETPFLYTVELTLMQDGKSVETVKKDIGFRKIEIRGNSLYVNNHQVKLHGVARHDITSYDGRAICDTALLRKDIEQLRNANCNFIRTSHYPPDEYMLDLCDRYGIFVEDEAPVCWDNNRDTRERADILFYCFKSMLYRDRSHPCVLLWSIANESSWNPRFYPCLLLAREETPHIPVKFSHSEYQGIKKGTDIGAKHYPGWQGLMRYENYFRPMLFGEALHLNCYNTSENITDPALRDLWGDYLKYFVDNMQESPAITGLGIWGAIDEMFYPKDKEPCGYGPWGVVDGFRREKPEFWHMKMAYSPVVVTSKHFQTVEKETVVSIENRYNVQNTNQVDIYWQDGDETGIVSADVLPMEQGIIRIPHQMKGDTLTLTVKDRRGFDISIWKLPRKYSPHYKMPDLSTTEKVEVDVSDSLYRIRAREIDYCFSRNKGTMVSVTKRGEVLLKSPLKMYLIPLLKENEVIDYIPQESTNDSSVRFTSDPLVDWKMESEKIEKTQACVRITVRGHYGELPVEFVYQIDGAGRIRIDYLLNIKKVDFDIRQIGVGFDLPEKYNTLRWNRKALWSVYPSNHIGRPQGEAKAFYPETFYNYKKQREIPTHSFAVEGNEFGSNDFRSTKHNIITSSFLADEKTALTVESNGLQHIRAWIQPDRVSFLVANYSNGGNEHYLNHDSKRTRYSETLKSDGGDVTGWIQLCLDNN